MLFIRFRTPLLSAKLSVFLLLSVILLPNFLWASFLGTACNYFARRSANCAMQKELVSPTSRHMQT